MPDETPEQKVAREAQEKEAREKAAREKAEQDALGDAGKRALEREREARATAEKNAREAQARIDALEAEKLTEAEQLKKKAEDGEKLAAQGRNALQKANLRLALTEKGLSGPKAKAAAKLIDGVEFDVDGEPTNLDSRIEAAKAEFGEDVFTASPTGETPEQKAAREKAERDANPDLHPGPRDGVSEDESAKLDAYVAANFPGMVPAAG